MCSRRISGEGAIGSARSQVSGRSPQTIGEPMSFSVSSLFLRNAIEAFAHLLVAVMSAIR